MLIYEKVFANRTGIRIVTVPDEALKKEVIKVTLRVPVSPTVIKPISLTLVDGDTDLSDEFLEAVLQVKIKDIGRKCKKCGSYFLPTSPRQEVCVSCKESD